MALPRLGGHVPTIASGALAETEDKHAPRAHHHFNLRGVRRRIACLGVPTGCGGRTHRGAGASRRWSGRAIRRDPVGGQRERARVRLGQATTGADGRFVVSTDQTAGAATASSIWSRPAATAGQQIWRRQSHYRALGGCRKHASCQRNDQRIHHGGIGVDQCAIPRWHRAKGHALGLKDRRRQRSQLRRSLYRRMGCHDPGPAQQRPNAYDGKLRHAG